MVEIFSIYFSTEHFQLNSQLHAGKNSMMGAMNWIVNCEWSEYHRTICWAFYACMTRWDVDKYLNDDIERRLHESKHCKQNITPVDETGMWKFKNLSHYEYVAHTEHGNKSEFTKRNGKRTRYHESC
jgi:hypothetical protein